MPAANTLNDVLKAVAVLNAGVSMTGEIIGLVRRQPDGEVDVIETLDSAGKKFKDVQGLVSDWKAENL